MKKIRLSGIMVEIPIEEFLLSRDVENYLEEIETQSPIVHTSHLTLIKLADKYGKKEVLEEIKKQTERKK